MEKFIRECGELDGVKYVSSKIDEEVEDDVNCVQIRKQELLFL